jgi:hypothetical protein
MIRESASTFWFVLQDSNEAVWIQVGVHIDSKNTSIAYCDGCN